ncbi:MAG: protoheme IX farnesyltransferase [Flavobacteriaceae bacterium]|nr:protoheme IX farnesyltransferase [Flavobacteriaceae bacterium]
MNSNLIQSQFSITVFLNDMMQLTKFRLTLSVVFSSLAGYLLAANAINFSIILLLFFGGFSIVGASNIINQILEKDLDKLMSRTKNRPLPNKRVSIRFAFYFALIMIFLGIYLLNEINFRTAFFSFVSLLIYTLIYTPLKTKTPFSVFFGAIPGALPFMLGWVAHSNKFGIEPGILFMIQFFWQFPHFWSIGWILNDDYKKAGFKMLPSGNKDKKTGLLIITYTLWMILISITPISDYSGTLNLGYFSSVIIIFLGLIMLYFAIDLIIKRSIKAAKKLMFSSIIYITLVQVVYVLDKILNGYIL